MQSENWKIINLGNLMYEVSDLGNVRRSFKSGKKNLKMNITSYGYGRICISEKQEKKYVFIHRLVAEYFIPNPDNKPYVNHKDGNKLNNAKWNLEWCTHSENMIHSYREIGNIPVSFWTGKKGKDHCRSRKVGKFDESGNILSSYDSILEASEDIKGSKGHISSCCQGKLKKYKGFCWKYL